MVDYARVLSDYAFSLKIEDVPKDVIETAKLFILDYYAAAFAGRDVNKSFNKSVLSVYEEYHSNGKSHILFSDKTASPMDAAFINAMFVHGADMDDGNKKAMGHVGAHVISAVFALADTMQDILWRDVLLSVLVGYEVYSRCAAAVQPGLVNRGFHSTGTAGAIGCAAACAKLLGLSSGGIYSAMGIAAIQSSGLMIISDSAQWCKPLNPANAARIGVASAKYAANGVEGPLRPLEGAKGWFGAMSESFDGSFISDGLGEKFCIMESYIKPYPSCRHTHCGIQSALELRDKIDSLKNVEEININIYHNAIQIAGQIDVPKSLDEAKFSIKYAFAVALVYGHYTLDDLKVESTEQKVFDIIKKITLIEDASMEDVHRGIRGSKTVIRMKNGQEYELTVLTPKGESENPFTMGDMKEKLLSCSHSSEATALLINKVNSICEKDLFCSITAFFKA